MNAIREPQSLSTPPQPPEQRGDFQRLREDLLSQIEPLWRRRRLIIGLVTLSMIIGVILVGRITPQYTASAQVIVEGANTRVINLQEVVEGMRPHRGVVLGQLEILRSTKLADRVIERLQLADSGVFNPRLRPPAPLFSSLNPMALAKDLVRAVVPQSWIDALKGSLSSEAEEVPEENPELQRQIREERLTQQIRNAYRAGLSVRQIGFSNVLSISYTTTDPYLAATIANTVAETYVLEQLEAKFDATRQATIWLNERLQQLAQNVRASEQMVAEFMAANDLVSTERVNLTEERLSELSNQYVNAQAQTAEAEARYRHVARMLEGGGSIDSATEVVQSPLIQSLRSQEADILRRIAELSNRYGSRHPTMVDAYSELGDLRRKIDAEVRRIASSLENEVVVARTREETLRAALEDGRGVANREDSVNIRLRELEREADANRVLYEAFLTRFKETSNQEDIQQADARVISEAGVPLGPSYPRKRVILMVVFALSLIGSIILVYVWEYFDRGLRHANQVENLANQPVLAMVPQIRSLFARTEVADYIIENPLSSAAESVRNLQTALKLFNPDDPPKVIGLTSSIAGEGKSTLAAWMAYSYASQGYKVLLIDGDLRRRSLSNIFDFPEGTPTIMDYALGEHGITDVAQETKMDNLVVVPGASMKESSLQFLGSERMRRLIDWGRSNFDYVVVDGPPVLAVSDALVLNRLIDAGLFLVRWNATDRDLFLNALKQLRGANVPLAGIVMSQVNVRRHAQYGYKDTGYYYGRYGGYYGGK